MKTLEETSKSSWQCQVPRRETTRVRGRALRSRRARQCCDRSLPNHGRGREKPRRRRGHSTTHPPQRVVKCSCLSGWSNAGTQQVVECRPPLRVVECRLPRGWSSRPLSGWSNAGRSADGRIAASAGDRVRPASARRCGKQDWERLAKPRDGYARRSRRPCQKVSAAVWERNLFLRKHGYIDNPKESCECVSTARRQSSRERRTVQASAQVRPRQPT